jgi:hypothetical protein
MVVRNFILSVHDFILGVRNFILRVRNFILRGQLVYASNKVLQFRGDEASNYVPKIPA